MYNIAIDFGTTNTMIGVYDLEKEQFKIFSKKGVTLNLKSYSAIPSKIGYSTNGRFKIGKAIDKSLSNNQIFTRMKLYLGGDSLKSIKRKIGNNKYDHFKAGEDFIKMVIDLIFIDYPPEKIEKMVLTAPVNSFDKYRSFLTQICEEKRFYNYIVVDESTSVALGYDAVISPDYPYTIIDFGGGTLDISVVRINNALKPNRVDVFGKAGSNLGGEQIDNWLLDHFLNQNCIELDDVKEFSLELKERLENLKIELSEKESASFEIYNTKDDYNLTYSLTREQFNQILKDNYLPHQFQDTLDTAIGLAAQNGIMKKDIKKVFLVGGSSIIPLFKELVELNFSSKVECKEPFSAVINGACKFISGTIVEDFLHHDYCLEHRDKNRGIIKYEVIVPQKTKFPIMNVCERVISPFHKGQTKIELKFVEMLSNVYENETISDITYDENGNLITIKDEASKEQNRKIIPINENKNMIILNPPSIGGNEGRIKLTFHVSENRILTVDALDLYTGENYFKNHEIARLK